MRTAFPFPVAFLLLCCSTEPELPPEAPRSVREVERWEVRQGSQDLGRVVLLEIEDRKTPLRFYRVENARGQWVGFFDMDGRVWRREPFREDVFLGMHTMESGLARLFDVEGRVSLAPVGALEASDKKER